MLTFNFKSPWQQASLKHFETKWSYSLKKKKGTCPNIIEVFDEKDQPLLIYIPHLIPNKLCSVSILKKKNGVVLYPDENELFDILSYIAIKWLLITLNVAYSISVPVCIHWDRFIIISPSDLRTIMTFFSFTWFVSK